jgi:hypothetical protein
VHSDAQPTDAAFTDRVDGDALTVALTEIIGRAPYAPALAALTRAPRLVEPRVLLWIGPVEHAPDDPDCAVLGERLRANVRATDLVCWLGSTGYAVLLAGAGQAAAIRVADRLTRMLDTPVTVVTLHVGNSTSATLHRLAGAGALPPAVAQRVEPAPPALSDAMLIAPAP